MSHSAIPISISSEVAPEFREFERISTTVLNAYLTPVTAKYLSQLEDELSAGRLVSSVSVMRSSGGLMSISDAAAFPAAVLLSGPAGGVIAARAVATQLGHNAVISFDMGGTTVKLGVCEGATVIHRDPPIVTADFAGAEMLYIHPDECIDCTLCEPECPAEAIVSEEDLPAGQAHMKALNAELARLWPVITEKKPAPADADEWKGKPNKLKLLER